MYIYLVLKTRASECARPSRYRYRACLFDLTLPIPLVVLRAAEEYDQEDGANCLMEANGSATDILFSKEC